MLIRIESRLESHDVAIRLAGSLNGSARKLRFLLLSPNSVAATTLEGTLERVERFVALTGGSDIAIAFLLQPRAATASMTAKQVVEDTETASSPNGLQRFTSLQAKLAGRTDIPYVPLLPLSCLEKLPDLLTRHKSNLQPPPHRLPSPRSAPSQLLRYCSAAPPLPDSTTFFVADIFTSYRDLARACIAAALGPPESSSPQWTEAVSSQRMQIQTLSQIEAGSSQTIAAQSEGTDRDALSKLQRLRLLVGEEQYQNVVQFWREEWVLE